MRSWRSDLRKIQTRPYFGAGRRLQAGQGYEEINGTSYMLHERRGYFSEHHYDALDRRVLVRTRRDGLCRKATIAQYNHHAVRPWFEFEDQVFFESNVALPHEGLHTFYWHHPEPNVEYEVLHDRIDLEQQQCALR
jgi:hypothetical protein